MKLNLKLSLLVLALFVLYGYNKNQTEEIIGKYFDLEEKNATHYIDFKDDKTYYHYYKNEKIEKNIRVLIK
ncbi:hypothetical protein V3468_03295 [Flavobacterium oreochromis]|uniref:hypothetical protein n=1 Tax=Flavobacterium oreochromis TaxID=2906078 RepID=UPI00385F2542